MGICSSCFLAFPHSKMCRGLQEGNRQASLFLKDVVSSDGTVASMSCELCGTRASIYCQADDAFLCRKCDKWVHEANFLALRHIRCLLCKACQKLTQRYLIGASREVLLPTIVSSPERRQQCDPNVRGKCSRTLKRPFLFL